MLPIKSANVRVGTLRIVVLVVVKMTPPRFVIIMQLLVMLRGIQKARFLHQSLETFVTLLTFLITDCQCREHVPPPHNPLLKQTFCLLSPQLVLYLREAGICMQF